MMRISYLLQISRMASFRSRPAEQPEGLQPMGFVLLVSVCLARPTCDALDTSWTLLTLWPVGQGVFEGFGR